MHELSLLLGLIRKIQTIAQARRARRITRVKIRLGALSHMSPDHFREHFEQAARGTPAEDATLEVMQMTDISDPNAQDILLDSIEIEGGAG